MWRRDRLNPPHAVTEATKDYLTSQDVLQAFIDECCACGPQHDDTVEHIWKGWKDWAMAAGEYVGTKRKLGERLEDKGFARTKGAKGVRKHLGIHCLREVVEASKANPLNF